jgi:hypothetical protein
METKVVKSRWVKEIKFSISPAREVVTIVPTKTSDNEINLAEAKGRQICSYLKDRTKVFEGRIDFKGTVIVREKIAQPAETIYFNWLDGILVASREPTTRNKHGSSPRR